MPNEHIRIAPKKGGGFIAALYVNGSVVAEEYGFTRWEAKRAVIKSYREQLAAAFTGCLS